MLQGERINPVNSHCPEKRSFRRLRCWLEPLCLLTTILAVPAEASPRSERVAERRIVRAEQAAARAEIRLERLQPQAPVAAPSQTLRPGVVRRLLRKGMTPEEIAAISGGGAVATANGAQPLTVRQAEGLSTPREQPSQLAGSESPRGGAPTREKNAGQSKTVPDPQVAAAAGGTPDGTRSVLVTGAEPMATGGDGPIFPGLATQKTSAGEPAAVVTHEPVELLPAPKPQE